MDEADRRARERLLGRTARREPLELVIAASLVVLAVVVFLSERYMVETFERSRTWNTAALETRARLTESRLLLEPASSGDRGVGVSRRVFEQIERAQVLCRALTDGGRTFVGTVERLPAGEARSTAATACAEIARLRSAATTELGTGARSTVYPSYARALRSMRSATMAADRYVQDRHLIARRVNEATTVALVLLLAAVIALVRRHHRRVRELAERSASILTTAGEGIYGIDADGRTTFVNPEAARITGHTVEELLDCNMHDAIHHSRPDGSPYPVEDCPVHAALREDTLQHSDRELYWRKDGSCFPVDLTATPIRDDGEVAGAVVVFRDISERRQAEQMLERQRRQLADAEAVAGFGSWEWDVAADTVSWSDGLCRIYGLPPGHHPTRLEDVVNLTHPDDRSAVAEAVQKAMESGEDFVVEPRILRSDGQVRTLHGRGRVVCGEDGAVARLVGTARDITESREVERAKDEFVSVVSHELRTPLTSIRGSLGLLAAGALTAAPEKAERMLQIALDSTERLVRLINDILDIERIESNRVEMHRQPCDAAALIGRALEGVEPVATAADVALTSDAEPVELLVDPDRVLQALTNLLSNAIKFSPAGATVHVSCASRHDEVLIEVCDEGRGIPADKLESIFERFQQVDSSDSREKGGTGLGLAISRSIVEQHGGRIWAGSVVGQGSTISFTLPVAPSRRQVPPEPGAAPRPRVLVCDDDANVREVVATMLEQWGYDVIVAASGREAIELTAAERPSAVLLDLVMPGLTGWETALELADDPATREVPVVILSVLSPADSPPAPIAVAGWVEKPLDERPLLAALERALSTRNEIKRVLIVEDDADLATVMIELFERHGIETLHAASGVDAVQHSREVPPDVLILDIGLPDGDGFWVAEWLGQHERLRSVPIVVYSARDLDAADRARLDHGHTSFANKGSVTLEQFESDVLQIIHAVAPIAEVADDAR